jgi:hypothetical protein
MSTGLRILICVVVAVVTVVAMVAILHATIGHTSNAIVGGVGALVVFATWYLTGAKSR